MITARDMHVDQVLTQIALDYRPEGMIADLIFPIVPVLKQSDYYVTFSRADALRIENDKRSPGTEANKVTRSMSSATYFADNYALRNEIFLEDKSNADPLFLQKLYEGRTMYVVDKLALGWESRVALMCTSGSNVGSYSAVGSSWTDITNANPFTNINTAIDNVQDSTGKRPNRMVMGQLAWRLARRNTNVINKIFGTNNGGNLPSRQQVADLFEVDEILVGGAYQNTGNEAQAEALSQIWGANVLVYYAPMVPSVEQPSFGYTLRWAQPGLPQMTVERHPYDPRKKKEDVEVGVYQDEKITGSSYGFLIRAVNSST